METARTATGGHVSEEIESLGQLPSEAELRALIERYAGSQRVTCELADEFFASVGEALPAAVTSTMAREVDEVAGGSWLEKIGGVGSSAPPRPRSTTPSSIPRPRRSSVPPALTITPVPPQPQRESVEHALEHLPAATYSTLPPPSALPSAPIALPLSSHPPLDPVLQPSAAESVMVWGPARQSSRVPPLPASVKPEARAVSARPSVPHLTEVPPPDARSSSVPPLPELARPTIPPQEARSSRSVPAAVGSVKPEAHTSSVPPLPSLRPAAAASSVEEAFMSAEEDALLDQWSDASSAASSSDVAPAADEPEPWKSAQQDEAPLSAAEVSLLDQWSADPAPPKPESAITGGFVPAEYAAAVYAPSRSQQPPDTLPSHRPISASGSRAPAPVTSSRPPIPAAAIAASQRPARVVHEDAEELSVEEIELEPDDLIEIDSE